jgi:tetratricopeptide (TPR) repeat protein
MAIEGKLEDVGLADICQLLAMGRKSGRLSVTDRSNFAHIFFDGGTVVHATVLNRPDRLGERLVQRGLVEATHLQEARRESSRKAGVHYAQVLVEAGRLAREDLERFQAVEVEEAVYHLFTWEKGSFHFTSDHAPERGVPVLVHLVAENLLLEGARRVDEWPRLRESVSEEMIYRRVEGVDVPPIPPLAEKVLGHLDGSRTVAEVVQRSGLVEFEVFRAIFDLAREGVLAPVEGTGVHVADAGGEEAEEEAPVEGRALDLGRAFYETGMFEEAERELRKALAEDPGAVEALDRLALIALRADRLDEALDLLERADEAGSVTYARVRNRALTLERMGRFEEALEVLDAAREHAAADPDLLLARAILLLKSFRAEEALQAFRGYREELDGQDPEPLFFSHALIAAEMAGASSEAMRLGREGLTVHPWSGPILVNLGAVLERRGELAAAEALYLRAVGESETPAQAHRNLGDLAFRRGDEAAARGHYERAVRLAPTLGDGVLVRLGNLLYGEGDGEAARRFWSKALELNPENDVARTNLGMLAGASEG